MILSLKAGYALGMHVLNRYFVFLCIFILMISTHAFSSTDESLNWTIDKTTEIIKPQSITDLEVYDRSVAVLKNFSAYDSSQSQSYINDIASVNSAAEIAQILKWFDPIGQFQKMINLSKTEIQIFKDINSKKNIELNFHLPQNFETSQKQNLENLSSENFIMQSAQPLQGLKIAIDPGHMGGTFWDRETGKHVNDGSGHELSEGLLNLQTAILLKVELEKRGAKVMLTRDDLRPVSNVDYKTFDLNTLAKEELSNSFHENWFVNLIQSNSIGEALYKSFQSSSSFKSLFSESRRSEYFIKRIDLYARAEMMDVFLPDLVLIIHYDTASDKAGVSAQSPHQTKSFVFGGYEQNEMGSPNSRKYLVRHLLDKKSWQGSVHLSRSIVKSLNKNLQLNLATSADSGAKFIEPGIFARNLVVPRQMKTSAAIAYLECLFYDRKDDFQKLIQKDHDLLIGNQKTYYSDYLLKIVSSITEGVVQYSANASR